MSKIKHITEILNELNVVKRTPPAIPGISINDTLQVNGKTLDIHIDKTDHIIGLSVVFVNDKFEDSFKQSTEFYIGKNGSDNAIGNRYNNIASFVENNDFITASEASVNAQGHVMFGNGRHRYSWLRDNNATQLPVAMDKDSIVNAKKYGYING